MDDLIEALKIFRKYGNPSYPTHCEHDVMYIVTEYDKVSDEDISKLEDLGFDKNEDDIGFKSFKFGSA